MREFLEELKRRHVYRIAVFYAAAAWLLVQIADVVVENFNLPERFMQLFIVFAALGFPLALMLAWLSDKKPAATATAAKPVPVNADQSHPQARGESTGTAVDDRPGIVVLPFDCFSAKLEDEVACNGFTEDLTTLLAHMPGCFVISRNTAFSYKGQQRDLREIGRELNVRYLLEGSMRHTGNQIRVTAQLIDAESGSHLWAEKYDTAEEELPQVQDALMQDIAARLDTEIARAEFSLARRQHPNDMNAWSLFQSAKGTLMFKGWSRESIREATEQLHKAIELDPNYAAPHAYLSLLLALGHWIKLVDDLAAAHDESVAAANRALELDPGSSEVLGYAGCAFSDLGYRQRGIPILQKAIELDASNAQAKAALGAALIVSGDLGPGIAQLTEAIRLSPKDPGLAMWTTILALASGYTGDIDSAEKWATQAYGADPRFFPALVVRAWILGVRGQTGAAQAALNEATRLNPSLDAAYIGGFLGEEIVKQMQEVGLVFPVSSSPDPVS